MATLLYASTHSPSLYCVYTPPISHSPSFSLLSLHDHTNHFLFFLLPSLPKSSLPLPHLPSPPLHQQMKKDYLAGGTMADSADLVVLGAYYGTGSKGDSKTVQTPLACTILMPWCCQTMWLCSPASFLYHNKGVLHNTMWCTQHYILLAPQRGSVA